MHMPKTYTYTHTHAYAHAHAHAHIHMRMRNQRRSPPPILLQVSLQLQVTGTGRTTMVDASPTMTAARLSRVIEKQTGVPRGSFALYHASKPMCGTLEESGVASGSTVELKFRGRGGGPEPQATNSLEVEIATRPAQVRPARQRHLCTRNLHPARTPSAAHPYAIAAGLPGLIVPLDPVS